MQLFIRKTMSRYFLVLFTCLNLTSCGCKNAPKPNTTKTPTRQEAPEIGNPRLAFTSNKTSLAGDDDKTFQLSLTNNTDTPVSLADYTLQLKWLEEGGVGSTLQYKNANNNIVDKPTPIIGNLSHFKSQTILQKKDSPNLRITNKSAQLIETGDYQLPTLDKF